MMYKIISLFALSFVMSMSANAQSPEEEVRAVIESLFDGMRAGDSAMVASAFSRDAIMHTVSTNEAGEVVKRVGDLERFLTAIGSPHDEIWDERIGGFEINMDGELASVWTPYQFYVGENFSHCGVNSFQMARLNNEWKIMYIVDTRRPANCIE